MPRRHAASALLRHCAPSPSVRLRVALVFCALLAACDRPAPAPAVEPIRPVRTQLADDRALSATLSLPAEIKPRIETRYGFRVAGKLSHRNVSIGERVKAGQLLARLDSQDVRPAIDAARAALTAARTERQLAESELERVRELKAKGFVSQGQLDRQQASLDAARARAAQASAQLESARNASRFQTLRTDAAGVVTEVAAEAGQVVGAGQLIVRIAPLDSVEFAVDVPEAALAQVRLVEKWTATLTALPGKRFQAELRELSPVADPATRSYQMRLSILGDTQAIALGMSANVQADVVAEHGIVLPLSALVSRNDLPGVWVVSDELTVRRVAVTTGELRDDGVRILSGLSGGERVVIAGANLLRPEQQVRLLEGAQ